MCMPMPMPRVTSIPRASLCAGGIALRAVEDDNGNELLIPIRSLSLFLLFFFLPKSKIKTKYKFNSPALVFDRP